MASLPQSNTVTYEEWLRMPEVQDAVEDVVNGEIRIMPPANTEVWVVSPEARTVEILYLQDGSLRTAQILSQGALTPQRFPNVQVPLADIWPD